MNVGRKGATMHTVKVRKGLYFISFHGEGFLVEKRHYWYAWKMQMSQHGGPRFRSADSYYYHQSNAYVVPNRRYDSLKEFQVHLKAQHAERAMESLS